MVLDASHVVFVDDVDFKGSSEAILAACRQGKRSPRRRSSRSRSQDRDRDRYRPGHGRALSLRQVAVTWGPQEKPQPGLPRPGRGTCDGLVGQAKVVGKAPRTSASFMPLGGEMRSGCRLRSLTSAERVGRPMALNLPS